MNEAELEESPIDDAKRRIEHPFPGEGQKHGRNDEGQENKGASEGLAPEVPVKEKPQPQTQAELEHARDRRVDESIPNRRAEDAVVPQRDEVLHADKAAGNADFGVGDREQHALHKRISDKKPKQYDRRQ